MQFHEGEKIKNSWMHITFWGRRSFIYARFWNYNDDGNNSKSFSWKSGHIQTFKLSLSCKPVQAGPKFPVGREEEVVVNNAAAKRSKNAKSQRSESLSSSDCRF